MPIDTQMIFLIQSALLHAAHLLPHLKGGNEITQAGEGFGLLGASETEIRADKVLGQHFHEALTAFDVFQRVVVEGQSPLPVEDTTGLVAYVDPLDGSKSYKADRSMLPHGACITVVDHSRGGRYRDIIASGAINYLNGDLWIVQHVAETQWKTSLNHQPHKVQRKTGLDTLGNDLIIGELYYPQTRAELGRIFQGQKGNLRSLGSALLEMLMVPRGSADAFICGSQKAHEAGVGLTATLGAGGVACDWEGQSLLDRPYRFNSTSRSPSSSRRTSSSPTSWSSASTCRADHSRLGSTRTTPAPSSLRVGVRHFIKQKIIFMPQWYLT